MRRQPGPSPVSRYSSLSRQELAAVVPELLLIGHLIDRAGMPWCISAFGAEAMTRIAVEEWSAASPIYTRRMQQALGYAPAEPGTGDVVTIFKGLQLDIGAPPQFMDFRFTVHDQRHGEFQLAHCGALMDVEPMGEVFVRAMCHDIEDPTFDATAVASNPKAQVRPIHRPPRIPSDRHPHCAWSVTIDESHPPVSGTAALAANEISRAANIELPAIDPGEEGLSHYRGPLVGDLHFGRFCHSALVRIADEVCVQMHLLDRGFTMAVADHARSAAEVESIRRRQLVGIAGLAGERLARTLNLSREPGELCHSATRLIALHPLLNPSAYVVASLVDEVIEVRVSPAHEDGAWVSLCGPEWTGALKAIVRSLDPHLDVEVDADRRAGEGAWRLTVVQRDEPAPEAEEVTLTKFSTGANFAFEARTPAPVRLGSVRS